MATASSVPQVGAGVNSLASMIDAYTKARGTTTSSTERSNISQAGVDGLIQQILSSTQGLASVASGQKAAGLYNSSGNSMLVNDLLTQTAAKVGVAQAGTTKTVKTGGIAGGDLKAGLILAAGKSLLGPSVSGAAKKLGLGKGGKSIGDSIAEKFGLFDSSDVVSNSVGSDFGIDQISGVSSRALGDLPMTAEQFLGGASLGDFLGDAAGSLGLDAFGDATGDIVTSSLSDSFAEDTGSSFFSSLFGG